MPLLNLPFLLLLSRIWVLLLSRIWGVFIIKLQLIKLKNKKKGCYHLVRMKASIWTRKGIKCERYRNVLPSSCQQPGKTPEPPW